MNLSATTFDLTNARACAYASALAYSQGPFPSEEPMPLWIQDFQTDTQLFIQEFSDHILIAFRGSSSLRDWITDAQFLRTPVSDIHSDESCEVHHGFLTAYAAVHDSIINHLEAILALSRPIFITGHSLGGALAILCALKLKVTGFNIAQIYTFGQPRVGNGEFKAAYDARLGAQTFRCVYELDVVPRIPHLPSFTDPYRHCGQEVWLGDGLPPLVDPPAYQSVTRDLFGVGRALLARRFDTVFTATLADHRLNNYTRCLGA